MVLDTSGCKDIRGSVPHMMKTKYQLNRRLKKTLHKGVDGVIARIMEPIQWVASALGRHPGQESRCCSEEVRVRSYWT